VERLGRRADGVTFMKKLTKIIFLCVILISMAAFFLVMIPKAQELKSVGNRHALFECRNYLIEAKLSNSNSPSFNFAELPAGAKNFYGTTLIPYFDFLAKTNFVWGDSNRREIVIVSQKQYGDVHKPGFWNAFVKNPAYAVGYSDGTAGLISAEEFTNLNRTGFISLSNLVTNSEMNILK
jgi:hypothetical protein